MIYDVTVPQFVRMLQNLDKFFDKAIQHAEAKKYDVNLLLHTRLAIDQFPLVRQVQIACDTAKFAGARLAAKEAPAHADTETTVAELRSRIASVIAWLGALTEADFAGAATRVITTPRWGTKTLTGQEYALHHAIPNFYFHVATSYALLRHNGVDLGKMDYLGPMPFRDPG